MEENQGLVDERRIDCSILVHNLDALAAAGASDLHLQRHHAVPVGKSWLLLWNAFHWDLVSWKLRELLLYWSVL